MRMLSAHEAGYGSSGGGLQVPSLNSHRRAGNRMSSEEFKVFLGS